MIAISYRRDDSLPVAGRVYDRLQAEFGKGNVSMDFDSIPYGVDFRDHIKQMIERSKVVVAMIGPDWVGKGRHRTRRIDDPADFVRLEIRYALEKGVPVIPILIGNAPMPKAGDLPKDIEGLAFRNALVLDAGIDFHHHADRLIAGINRLVNAPPRPALTTPKDQRPEILHQAQISRAPIETQSTPMVAKTPPVSREFPPIEPSRPPAETTPAEIPRSSAERLESTVKVPKEPALPITPQKFPEIELSKPAKSKPPTESRKTIKTSTPILRADKAGWFARLKKSVTQLQDKAMADYVSLSRFGGEQKRVTSSRSQRKIALFGAIASLAIVVTVAGWYWGFRTPGEVRSNKGSGTKRLPRLLVGNESEPGAKPVVATVNSAPPPTASLIVKSARVTGTLKIDSTPQGLAFEIIDADSNHRTDTTPATLENLPKGYAQVFYKGTDSEHHEMVWIEGGKTSSTRWTVPDKAPSPVAQVPIAPPAPSVAPSMAPTWQARMEEFVKQFVESDSSGDVETELSLYATSAEILNEGVKNHDRIRHDIQSDHERWPIRRDTIRGEIRLTEIVPNEEYGAAFEQDYHDENPARGKSVNGAVAVNVTIKMIDGSPKISSIKQKPLPKASVPVPAVSPQTVAQEPPISSPRLSAPSNPPIIEGPQKLLRIVNKQYGFFAPVPAEVFPDAMQASETGQTLFSTTKGRTNLNFFVRDNSDGETFKKLYQEWSAEHTQAQPNKKVHYRPLRDKWFVVSGIDGPRGFYVEAVKKGNVIVLMSLEYDEIASPLTPQTLSKMSQILKEN